MSLLDLAERVEAAMGADRELDAEIAVLLSGDSGAWVVAESEDSIFSHISGWWRDSADKSHEADDYTASLDAAMALVDSDSFWRLGNDGEGPDVAAFKATVTAGIGPTFSFHDAVAATPALALTAASLRARHALAREVG